MLLCYIIFSECEAGLMSDIVKTMKLHIHVSKSDAEAFARLTEAYRMACNAVSDYVFTHDMNR